MLSQKTKVSTRIVEIEYPKYPTFKIQMSYIPREEMTAINKQCTEIKFSAAAGKREETVNMDKWIEMYVEAGIKGWSGLTYEIVSKLVPIETDEPLQSLVPYSNEDAIWLVRNSPDFERFFTDTMNQIELFTVQKKEEERKK